MRIRKAVIPAAGWGTRFLPATKAQPKEMLPLVDIPIIQYVVEEAVASGIETVLIVTGRSKRAIEDHFDRSIELENFLIRNQREHLLEMVRQIGSMADIHFVRQREQFGLGHAIYQARHYIGNEPFAVMLGDEIFLGARPCLGQLMEIHARVGGSVVGVQEVSRAEVSRYGIIEPECGDGPLFRALDLIEKPAPHATASNLAIIGRYILDPAIFPILATLPPGYNNEVQLTDGLWLLNRQAPIFGYRPETKRYDVGDKLGYVKATLELALRRPDMQGELTEYLLNLIRDSMHKRSSSG